MATKTTPNTLTEITTVSDMFKIRGRLPGVGLLLLFGLLTAGCASDAELDTLDPQSEVAETIWNLAYPVFILAGVVLVLICGAVLYLAFKHGVRTYEDDDEFPEQISHNNSLEIAWTIVPALIMAAIGVFTIITHIDINGTDDNSITDLFAVQDPIRVLYLGGHVAGSRARHQARPPNYAHSQSRPAEVHDLTDSPRQPGLAVKKPNRAELAINIPVGRRKDSGRII